MDSEEQLAFDIIEASVQANKRRALSRTHTSYETIKGWSEEEEREWRERSAVKSILTTHVLDNPCRMGKSHYGGCWQQPPEYDEFLAEIHRQRLDRLYGER